jgi:hypothetical protein
VFAAALTTTSDAFRDLHLVKIRNPVVPAHCGAVRCRHPDGPAIVRAMTNDARIEIRLPEQRRRELVELAAEKNISRADLVRLGINWLIEHPDAILKFPAEAA